MQHIQPTIAPKKKPLEAFQYSLACNMIAALKLTVRDNDTLVQATSLLFDPGTKTLLDFLLPMFERVKLDKKNDIYIN